MQMVRSFLKSVAQDNPLKTNLPEYGAHLLGSAWHYSTPTPENKFRQVEVVILQRGTVIWQSIWHEMKILTCFQHSPTRRYHNEQTNIGKCHKEAPPIQDLIPLGRDLGLAISAVALPDFDSFDSGVSMSPSATSQYPSLKSPRLSLISHHYGLAL